MLLDHVCRSLIQDGALTLIDADGRTHCFGRMGRPAEVVVRLHDRALHRALVTTPCRAVGEAYADGTLTIERGDVYDLVDLCARNAAAWEAHPLRRIERALDVSAQILGRGPAPAPRSAIGELLGERVLDWDRQTSCAYFSDPRMTLEEAQQAKKHHIASKLLLRPGQRVLEIGSGSGGLALHLADAEHVDVTGLAESAAELAVARRRALDAELGKRVSFHLRDFREEAGRYDRVVSVGLLEHLGRARYGELFSKIREVLHEDGVAVIHAIGRAHGPASLHPWIARQILPGAHLPALSEVLPAVEESGLWLTDLEVLRLHYAETLRHWRRRFAASWDQAAPHDARARRAWELALALAEVGFRRGGLMVFQLQLARRADAVPLTRDYLYERASSGELSVNLAA